MIPKSLIISVSIGVGAAAVLGLYLSGLNSPQIAFVEGPSISIYSDKQDYKIGEPIQIQIINTGTSELANPSLQVRALDGTVFFSTSFEGVKLGPKQKYYFEWNQQKNDNSKIIQGRYVAESFAHDQNNNLVKDSFTFNVLQ